MGCSGNNGYCCSIFIPREKIATKMWQFYLCEIFCYTPMLVTYRQTHLPKSLYLRKQTLSLMETPSKSHIGRKISRIRELRGMKQEALAQALGVSQQTVSTLENSEEIDEKRLKDVAEALGVSAEAIMNFSEEGVINYFNSFNEAVHNSHFGNNNNCTFNPLDKVVELYERLVQAEKDKVAYLEKLLDK